MARRTKEEAQATRNRILDIAEEIFFDQGVSRTSLADIAAAAGVTRGAIYWHFKNKTDLFDAMMQRVSLPMEQALARAESEDRGDPLGYVRLAALTVLERLTRDKQCQRVFDICCHKVEYVDEMAQLRERHIACRTDYIAFMERGLRRAAKQGLLVAGVQPRIAAIGLHALVDGLINNWILDPSYFRLAKAAEPLIDSYIAGIRRRRSPARRRAT